MQYRRRLAHQAMRRYAGTRAKIDRLEAMAARQLQDALLVEDTLLSSKLKAGGDTGSLGRRRATAPGMLGNPDCAVQMLGIHARWDNSPRTEA